MRISCINYVISSCLVFAAVGCNSSENTANVAQDSLLLPDSVAEFPVADAERSFPFDFQADATMVIPGGYYEQEQAERYLKQKFYGLMLDSSTMNYSIQPINLKKTMLSYIPFFDDGAVEILFVGDLDGDSYPDLLIDNAYKYTGKGKSIIFYSTKASKIKGMPVPVCQSEIGHFQSEFDTPEGC